MPNILYTSLNEIRSFNPCSEGWKDILRGQGKTEADNILFPLVDCLESNSISDVCWLLGKRRGEIEIVVKFAKDCADSVAHFKNAASASAYARAAAYAAASAYDAAYAASVNASSVNASSYQQAKEEQLSKNKQFLINRIREYEENH